jgi:hypothetical protein
MDISYDTFQDYLVEKGFKKDEHQLYKKVGGDLIICGFLSQTRYSTTICSFEILVTSECDDRNSFDVFFEWDDFKSSIKYILRDSRLDDILGKNKNIKNK